MKNSDTYRIPVDKRMIALAQEFFTVSQALGEATEAREELWIDLISDDDSADDFFESHRKVSCDERYAAAYAKEKEIEKQWSVLKEELSAGNTYFTPTRSGVRVTNYSMPDFNPISGLYYEYDGVHIDREQLKRAIQVLVVFDKILPD